MIENNQIEILVVDDEADIRNLIKGILEDDGYKVATAQNSQDVYTYMQGASPFLVVLDIWLQNSDEDGIEILKKLKKRTPELPVIMISGHGTVETAVSSIKQGAYDFIEKPFKSNRLLLMIKRALEALQLKKENLSLKEMAGPKAEVSLTGTSTAIQDVRQIIERAAPTNSRVLISGEPGTGKETAARLIHKMSKRSAAPMIVVNCATMQPARIGAELFGSEKDGKITYGILERANNGTVLFDEISDMPLEIQAKILNVLQEQTFKRVGGAQDIKVDVRFLATTNRNLEHLSQHGKFRKDLFYRLNVVPIAMPCLRERNEDIPELTKVFLKDFAISLAVPKKVASAKLIEALKCCDWPGNIRQLRNAVEWMMIMSAPDVTTLCMDYFPSNLSGRRLKTLNSANTNNDALSDLIPEMSSLPLREAREEFERHYLASQISKFKGNVSQTAKFIGMERSALHRKLKSLQLSAREEEEDTPAEATHKKQAAQ